MGIEGLTFAFREACGSIRRNSLMSAIAVTTVSISLFLLASILLLSLNLNHMADTWESQVHIRVDVAANVDKKGIDEIKAKLEATENVAKVVYVSKEENLERMKKQFGQRKDLLAGLESSNPLPNSFEIYVKQVQKTREVAGVIEKVKGVDKVKFGEDLVDKLFQATKAVRLFGLGLITIMGAGAMFIISNTIRAAVFARRREVAIMKLVGATDAIIRGPFLIEGLLLGVLGSVLSALTVWTGYSWIYSAASDIPFLPLMEPLGLLLRISLGLLCAGSLIGALGSGWSLRRYLRV